MQERALRDEVLQLREQLQGRHSFKNVISRSPRMHEIFEPIMAMIPPDASGKLEPAEIFHEILEHRWYLSETNGQDVGILEAAKSYVDNVLRHTPDERVVRS